MDVSCGVLIFDKNYDMLLCQVTGKASAYDIPKGMREDGELSVIAAIRECREETGIVLPIAGLSHFGEYQYMPSKDLHLFAIMVDSIDLSKLHCDYTFTHPKSGKELPEMSGYMMVPYKDAPFYCFNRMKNVLTHIFDSAKIEELFTVPTPINYI